jgi:hypothetical protein
MKRHLAWILALVAQFTLTTPTRAGDVDVTFEDFGLAAHSFNNNAGAGGFFSIDGNSFNNSYDPTFNAWSGWAISSMTDTTTPDFTNQYSAIPGSGAGGSQTYAVAYTFGPTSDPFHPAGSFINLAAGVNPVSVEVTNTTYAYYTMLNGSQFSAPFTANSFFRLDVAGYTGASGTGTLLGDVTLNLATGTNIVNTWQTLNLSSLSGAGSLVFGLQSSDNDPVFGMNTPAYVAIDNLMESNPSVVPEPGSLVMAFVGIVTASACLRKRRHKK